MKRKLVVAAATLSLFPIFLITLLPASVARGWFSLRGIGFTGVSGTVWTGSIAQISSADISLGRLQWSNGSLAGLIGRPAWDIELNRPDGFVRGRVAIRSGGTLSLDDVDAVGSLESLGRLLPLYGTRGGVTARIDRLRVEGGQIILIKGRVVFDTLITNALKSGDLGSIELIFHGDDAAPLTGQVTAIEGPLQIRDGQIRIGPDGSYEIDGRIAPAPGAPSEIVDAMQFFGSPDSEGFRQFSQAGSR
jgi:hypothetical protein